jgi:hypothetical protein
VAYAYAEFTRPDGSSIVIDQRSEDVGFHDLTSAEPGGIAIRARASLNQAVNRALETVTETFLSSVNSLSIAPDEMSVEFSLRISAEVGAVITQEPASSHFRITLRWKSNPDLREPD